jgi:glycosyltransferase involved in cell wall biosynthesis
VGAYQQKLVEMARHSDLELTAVVPPSWREGSFERRLEPIPASGYRLVVSPITANGNFHFFFFPQLGAILDEVHPDLVHVDEEPYNFATFMAIRQARARRIPSLFFSWQNLNRRYPLPFRMVEEYAYRSVGGAIAGTTSAERILRQKGYRGPVRVIPQFGVDPEVFSPMTQTAASPARPFRIGFAGRLVPEKGVDLLVEACAGLSVDFELVILGQGPALSAILSFAAGRGIESKVLVKGSVPSTEMAAHLRELDVLVLPSLTRPNWAEQFGRILVEAMACGVPVIGSSSGDIPAVIGDAGLVVPEGRVDALRAKIELLAGDPAVHADLSTRGRQRVLDHFTQARIAEETVAFYRELLAGTPPST